jgi:hypothetical protein
VTRGALLRTLAATVAALACMSAVAGAQAAVIHACVKPKSGATRIVGAKAKCRHGEQKLSWNTSGPAGPKGVPGAPGAPGAAGAEGKPGVAGAGPVYSASAEGPTGLKGGATLVTKVLPPGSFAVSAKTLLIGQAETAAIYVQAVCFLGDAPGINTGAEPAVLDETGWLAALVKLTSTNFSAEAASSLQGTLTSKVTSTVSLSCTDQSPAGVNSRALFSALQALSVTSVL